MWKKPLGEHISVIYLNETEIKLGCAQHFSEIIIFELLAVKLKKHSKSNKG